MNKSKFPFLSIMLVLFIATAAWGHIDAATGIETYNYDIVNHGGDKSFNSVSGRKAQIEVYALGGGGGGQGGHGYSEWFHDYRGTGGAGGGGGAAYMKFYVTGQVKLDIFVGKGGDGSPGVGNCGGLGFNCSANAGNSGGSTTVIWRRTINTTLTAGGAGGGGRYRASNNKDFTGGGGGGIAISEAADFVKGCDNVTSPCWYEAGGGAGANGNQTADVYRKGGNAGVLNIGTSYSFPGSIGFGGDGGYNHNGGGGRGGDGGVKIVVTPFYKVTFDPNGGSVNLSSTEIFSNTKIPITAEPERESYTFRGWHTAQTGGSLWDFNNNHVTSDITLWAKWEPETYNITYHLNGGTNHNANPETYTIESPAITLQSPTNGNHTFLGWHDNDRKQIPTILNGSTGNITLYAKWNTPADAAEIENIESVTYNGSKFQPKPIVTYNGVELTGNKDFNYYYEENINAGVGTVFIIGKTAEFYGETTREFTINKAEGICSVSLENLYVGEKLEESYMPVAISSTNNAIGVTYRYWNNIEGETAAITALSAIATPGTYSVKAMFLETPNYEACIAKNTFEMMGQTNIEVEWSKDSVFTYNKMVQAPIPSAKYNGEEIKLIRSNAHNAAGKYYGMDAATAEIEDQAIARKFNLINRTKNYEIQKRELKPYFSTTLPAFKYSKEARTLEVPSEIFTDPETLINILESIIDYEGFATDTIKKESDDISVLDGKKPSIEFDYSNSQGQNINAKQMILGKRVETQQRATATIISDGITTDNYTLNRQTITIIEMDDNESADIIYCNRRSDKGHYYCAELSEEVCRFVGGNEVQNCNIIRANCMIDETRCVSNMLLTVCNNFGGEAIESCGMMSPIGKAVLPYAPMTTVPTYYNLQGKPLGTIKPTTPGIYIEKADKNARKILVK